MRVRAVGVSRTRVEKSPAAQLRDVGHLELLLPAATATNRVYFETSGWLSTPVYGLKTLPVDAFLGWIFIAALAIPTKCKTSRA